MLMILNYVFNTNYIEVYDYLFYDITLGDNTLTIKAGLSYYLILNQLIPMVILGLMEVCKIMITLFISRDTEMIDPVTGKGCKCLTFSLHEDMGLLKYIITDKTGTLTANKLTFRGASIGNKKYFESLSD